MSILIKGMKMPKEGGVIVIYKEGNSFYTTKEGEGRRYPLIHVSPHGRLIDADWTREEIDKDRPGRMYEDAWALTVMDNSPTIIEAEEGDKNE